MTRDDACDTPYYRQRLLCSAGEFRFYRVLQAAVADLFLVMMKVRVAALLRCREADWDTWGRRVSQKEFDFVLVERGTSFVAAAVELDDKTHDLAERKKRDRFLEAACAQAGLPLVRVRVVRSYDTDHLRQVVLDALAAPAAALDYGPRSMRSMSDGERRSTRSIRTPQSAPLRSVRACSRPRGRFPRRGARQLRRRRR